MSCYLNGLQVANFDFQYANPIWPIVPVVFILDIEMSGLQLLEIESKKLPQKFLAVFEEMTLKIKLSYNLQ